MTSMLPSLVVVFLFWCLLYALHKLLFEHGLFINHYRQFQDTFGVSISFAHLRIYTTRFNRLFKVWGGCSRKLARLWFDVGVLVGLLLMGLSVVIMVLTLYQNLIKKEQSKEKLILTPLMPGINLPWNEVSYYFITIIVCGVFHEVGHAFAAVTEQVRINGFGVFLLFIYPGAFVDLHSDHLTIISPKRQLRIYCAGVWHNVILSIFMALFLQGIPFLLFPFYSQGNGATIIAVEEGSALFDKVSIGDAIIEIDSCKIANSKDWYSCILDITSHVQTGYCVSSEYLHSHNLVSLNDTTTLEDSSIECCPENERSMLCFTTIIHLPDKKTAQKFTCLTARQVVSTDAACHTNEECLIVDPKSACVTPTIATTQHSHLAKIEHSGEGDPVIFLGDLRTLLYSVKVSDFSPVSTSAPLWLPSLLQTTAIYIISISSALGLLNMLPAYALDGQWALSAFMENICPDYPKRNTLVNSILTMGTILLIMNVILGVWTLINW